MRAPRFRARLEALEEQDARAGGRGRSRPALALIGRDACSGSSLKRRESTRIASKPAQM